jgi:glycosyltransferase involved in cell wall biosynthesis
VVTTVHGPFDETSTFLYQRIATRAAIIAISFSQARAAHALPIARVVHHGLDTSAYRLGTGGDHLLFLGRMAPEKGAHRAARIAREAGVPLLLAAKMREPAEREYFETWVQPLLGGGVEYVGEASEREKIELLGSAAALLNPIRWPEPFGLVMIEALACGTPVITFDEGAAAEIVLHGETGFVCRTEQEMIAAIGRVEGIDRRVCRRSCESRFSMERMAADHIRLYDEVLRARARAGLGPGVRHDGRERRGASVLSPGLPPQLDARRQAVDAHRVAVDVDVDRAAGVRHAPHSQELDVRR